MQDNNYTFSTQDDVDGVINIDKLTEHETIIKELRTMIEKDESACSGQRSLRVHFKAGQQAPNVGLLEVEHMSRGNQYFLMLSGLRSQVVTSKQSKLGLTHELFFGKISKSTASYTITPFCVNISSMLDTFHMISLSCKNI